MRGVQALRCIAHQNKSFSTNNTEQTLKKDHLLRSIGRLLWKVKCYVCAVDAESFAVNVRSTLLIGRHLNSE